MFRKWRDRGLFESTEERVCDQARAIRKNGLLLQLELEAIKRQAEDEFQGGFGEDDPTEVETVENEDTAENEAMVEDEVKSVAEEIVKVEEVNNNVTDSVDDTRHTLNDEHRKIVDRLYEIMLEGKTSDGIMFKKVYKKTLKVQTDRVNEAIRYFKSKNITETNDLIKAASVWAAQQIGLKKRDYREKNEPRWKRRTEGDIKKLRQDVNLLTRDLKGELGSKKKQKMKELYGKYRVKKKELKTVIEELIQRMLAKSATEKEREKKREREKGEREERETERDTERQREKQRDRERQRETERQRERQRETETERDTKLESPRERRCPRILDQEPQQSTRTCFLANE